jgi:hypothetical protein
MSDSVILTPQKEPPTPDEIAFNAGPKCGECRHWRQEPAPKVDMAAMEAAMQAQNVPLAERRKIRERAMLQNSGKALGAERTGQCRRELLTIGRLTQDGRVAPVSYYPGGIPSTWPCCGHFDLPEWVMTAGLQAAADGLRAELKETEAK